MTIHILKGVEAHIRKIPQYTKLIIGEVELTNEYGTYAQQLRRLDEVSRISSAIQDTYNELDSVKKPFITLYYFSNRVITVEAAGDRLGVSRKTAVRWRKEFLETISKSLGWI